MVCPLLKKKRNVKGRFFLFCLCLNFTALAATMPASDAGSRLAIVVGKKAVSANDLHQRLRLAALSSGLKDTPDILDKIKMALTRAIIDEQLQTQAALAVKLDISAAEIQQAVENLEKANSMPKGALKQFLQAQHIPFETIENQIRANILWVKYIQEKYIPTLQIRDQDVDTYLKMLQANQGKTQYHLAEIVLYVETPGEEKKVHQEALQLMGMLQQGAPFPGVAHQFSQAPSSAQGGEMGWVTAEEMEKTLQTALEHQETGRFSGPWRTAEGYTILALIEKRGPQKGLQAQLPSREEVMRSLQSERLELLARRELSQLRNKTFIDIRS